MSKPPAKQRHDIRHPTPSKRRATRQNGIRHRFTPRGRAFLFCGTRFTESQSSAQLFDLGTELITAPLKVRKLLSKGAQKILKKKLRKEIQDELLDELMDELEKMQNSHDMKFLASTKTPAEVAGDPDCFCNVFISTPKNSKRFQYVIWGRVGNVNYRNGATDCCEAEDFSYAGNGLINPSIMQPASDRYTVNLP